MTPPRATQQALAIAAGHLEQLAWDNHPLFPTITLLLDLLVWNDEEIRYADKAAAYGPGTSSLPTLASFPRGLDDRPTDHLLKELRRLRRSFDSQVNATVTHMQHQAFELANWPARTQDAG